MNTNLVNSRSTATGHTPRDNAEYPQEQSDQDLHDGHSHLSFKRNRFDSNFLDRKIEKTDLEPLHK